MPRGLFVITLLTIGGAFVVGGPDLRVRRARANPSKGAAQSDSSATVRTDRATAEGRDAEAIAGLKDAYEKTGQPSVLFELGELHHKLGREAEAERFYRAYLTRDPKGPSHEAAQRRLRQFDLAPAAGRGTFVPASNAPAPGTAVRPPPTSPAPLAHVQPISRTAPPPVAPAPAVRVANEPARLTPPAPVGPAAGARGGASPAIVATREAGAAPAPQASLPIPRWVPWTGAVLTVGLLTGAIITGTAASRRYDQLRTSCGATSAGCPAADVDGVKSKATVANLLWAATAVAGIATGIVIYIDSRDGSISKRWSF